jgi:preprotein translocase subunit SecE
LNRELYEQPDNERRGTVTETSTADAAGSGRTRRDTPRRGNPVGRLFGALALFIRQILDELRKVVRPTRRELVTYTSVVIVFVTVVMTYVWGLDQLVVKLVALLFGNK